MRDLDAMTAAELETERVRLSWAQRLSSLGAGTSPRLDAIDARLRKLDALAALVKAAMAEPARLVDTGSLSGFVAASGAISFKGKP